MNVLDKRATGMQGEMPQHPRVRLLGVKDILAKRTPQLTSVDPQLSLLAALRLMHEQNLAALMVVAEDCRCGIFSVDDFARLALQSGSAALSLPVGEAVIRDAVFASPDDSVQVCLQLMAERKLRFLPVKQDGKPVDMLSLDELLGELVEYYGKIIKANELDQQLLFLRGTYSC
jgi:CBS domain-containing protein